METQEAPVFVELNNHSFSCAKDMHNYLAAELAFPEYYGHNLDALHDCLTDIYKPTVIRIRRTWHQDLWFQAAARVIRDAAKANPNITVVR